MVNKKWGMGLQGVVTCFAIKKPDRFDSDMLHFIRLAQLVERRPYKTDVVSSSLSSDTLQM